MMIPILLHSEITVVSDDFSENSTRGEAVWKCTQKQAVAMYIYM